jgi:hypothetical protein
MSTLVFFVSLLFPILPTEEPADDSMRYPGIERLLARFEAQTDQNR